MEELNIIFGISIIAYLCVIGYLLQDIRDELRNNNN
jgi:hypothetical protein